MNRSYRSAHNFEGERDHRYIDFPPPRREGAHRRSHSSRVMRVHNSEQLRMSSLDDPTSEERKSDPTTGSNLFPKGPNPAYSHVQYKSTPDGDVVVVEPSFDAEDKDGRGPVPDAKGSIEGESRISPSRRSSNHHKGGHSRNLSEHFYDATTISNDNPREPHGGTRDYPGYRVPPPSSSPAVGQKHRRVFSGDRSNPAEAHRRVNSIGNSAAVRRPYIQERQHQRVDSAGLDILTAAADASREELAAAAGERGRHGRGPWDVPIVSYDHSSAAHPPPPSRGHSHPYQSGPPTPTGYYSSHGYPHPSYPPPSFYSHPPPSGYQRSVLAPPPGGYPVQYSRGPDPYSKYGSQGPLHQPNLERPRDDTSTSPKVYRDTRERGPSPPTESSVMTPPPPVPPSHWRGGSTQGVQTYVTAIGVGDSTRTMQPTLTEGANSADARHEDTQHHRKTSSISSWVPPMSVFLGPPGEIGEHPLKGHHRSTSSSVSFLGLDVGLDNTDATFLKNLQASTGMAAPGYTARKGPTDSSTAGQVEEEVSDGDGSSKLAPGGTSKRVRRKCTVEGCPNRVVQGGLCISHGARRKLCKHPGCNKNVKKAGLCSSHGPARKRCETEGCTKVSVQGGRCIAHGAKKKLCSVENCAKQAILNGMCKKHHDQSRKDSNRVAPPPADTYCKVIEPEPTTTTKTSKPVRKPTHTRGLSLFQEMSAETVGNLLSGEEAQPPAPSGHGHRSTFSREFGNLY